MNIYNNPHLRTGISGLDSAIPFPCMKAEKPTALLKDCLEYRPKRLLAFISEEVTQ